MEMLSHEDHVSGFDMMRTHFFKVTQILNQFYLEMSHNMSHKLMRFLC